MVDYQDGIFALQVQLVHKVAADEADSACNHNHRISTQFRETVAGILMQRIGSANAPTLLVAGVALAPMGPPGRSFPFHRLLFGPLYNRLR